MSPGLRRKDWQNSWETCDGWLNSSYGSLCPSSQSRWSRNINRYEVLATEVPDVAHHHVDEGVFYQAEKDKESAGGHEHVNRLEIKIYFHF